MNSGFNMLQNRQVKVVQVRLEVIQLLKSRKSGLQGLLWAISNHKQMGPMVLGKVNHQSYHIYIFFITFQFLMFIFIFSGIISLRTLFSPFLKLIQLWKGNIPKTCLKKWLSRISGPSSFKVITFIEIAFMAKVNMYLQMLNFIIGDSECLNPKVC